MVAYSFVNQRFVASALALVAAQAGALFWMSQNHRSNYDTIMVGVAFAIAASFFVGTSTGIRGVYEMAVIAPFIIGRAGLSLTIAGLRLYPIMILKFYNLEAFGPHLLDFLWAIH